MILIGIVLFFIICFVVRGILSRNHEKALMEKYNDAEMVARLLAKEYWVGMTFEQLKDSLGTPLDIDRRVIRTKTSEIWKYNKIGKNRFGRKLYLENGLLIGWEEK